MWDPFSVLGTQSAGGTVIFYANIKVWDAPGVSSEFGAFLLVVWCRCGGSRRGMCGDASCSSRYIFRCPQLRSTSYLEPRNSYLRRPI